MDHSSNKRQAGKNIKEPEVIILVPISYFERTWFGFFDQKR
jgi:hypothetical protein